MCPLIYYILKRKKKRDFSVVKELSFYFDYKNANCFQVYMNDVCFGEFSSPIYNYIAPIYLSCQGQSITAVHTQYFKAHYNLPSWGDKYHTSPLPNKSQQKRPNDRNTSCRFSQTFLLSLHHYYQLPFTRARVSSNLLSAQYQHSSTMVSLPPPHLKLLSGC